MNWQMYDREPLQGIYDSLVTRTTQKIFRAHKQFIVVFLIAICGCLARSQDSASPNPFSLHDGETVVFYGDSITAQRFYTRFVEDFVLTRYPTLHIRFVNAGVPGDTI